MAIIKKSFSDLIDFTRGSAATYTDATGNMRTASIDEPRFTYDPATGKALGLLVEGQATNLLLWSEDFTRSSWTKRRVTVSAAAGENYFAGSGVYKLACDATGETSRYIHQGGLFVDTSTRTISVVAKPAELNGLSFRRSNIRFTQGNYRTTFRFDTMTADNGGEIEPLGGGWYRCSVSLSADEAGSDTFGIWLVKNGEKVFQGAVGEGIYIAHAQEEIGTRPTSYIPTESSQMTRAADELSEPIDSFPFNPLEGTFIIKLRRDYDYGDPFADTVLSIMDGTNYWSLELGDSTRTRCNVMPTITGEHTTPYVTFDGGINKVALSVHAPNQYKIAVNGRVVNVSGDNSGAYSVYQIAKEIRLKRSSNVAIGEDKFSEITYYPRALTDAELQELTK